VKWFFKGVTGVHSPRRCILSHVYFYECVRARARSEQERGNGIHCSPPLPVVTRQYDRAAKRFWPFIHPGSHFPYLLSLLASSRFCHFSASLRLSFHLRALLADVPLNLPSYLAVWQKPGIPGSNPTHSQTNSALAENRPHSFGLRFSSCLLPSVRIYPRNCVTVFYESEFHRGLP